MKELTLDLHLSSQLLCLKKEPYKSTSQTPSTLARHWAHQQEPTLPSPNPVIDYIRDVGRIQTETQNKAEHNFWFRMGLERSNPLNFFFTIKPTS